MRKYHRRGVSLLYGIIALTAVCGLLSLALDFGRVEIVKNELRRSADSAARAAAAGLLINSTEATSQAQQYASLNDADGVPVKLDSAEDIEFGSWDPSTRTFTKQPTGDIAGTDTVRVIARKSVARGDGVPMLFASLVGFRACNVSAESVAKVTPPINVDQSVPATGNPFLAGMPAGSVASLNNPHNNPDYAGDSSNPKQSPLLASMSIQEGQSLSFDSISGTAKHDPSLAVYNPDGDPNDVGHNSNGNEDGIADMTAPINALVGVFLDDNAPNLTAAPSENLDFSTPASRDFNQLKPVLKQIFFIGDGLTSDGTRQEFIAPPGATRLFLATWDYFEWNNNSGARDVTVIRPMSVTTVR